MQDYEVPVTIIALLVGGICIGVYISKIIRKLDRKRVAVYFEQRKCKLLTMPKPTFFQCDLFCRDTRLYYITYQDENNNIHSASVRTAIFANVFFSNDKIISDVSRDMQHSLNEENTILKKQLKYLEEENTKMRQELVYLKATLQD
ncbi:hypothetical protein AAEX28_02585 [Lentisphaerota bacterium WC36G]|nr:hypothetical protein LJT99_05470 [Lentisphaerae bacterium WC36]